MTNKFIIAVSTGIKNRPAPQGVDFGAIWAPAALMPAPAEYLRMEAEDWAPNDPVEIWVYGEDHLVVRAFPNDTLEDFPVAVTVKRIPGWPPVCDQFWAFEEGEWEIFVPV